MSIGGMRVSDYEDVEARPITTNKGPVCSGCGKPFRVGNHESCELAANGLDSLTRAEGPITRQAAAMELIAFNLGKIVKHLEATATLADAPAPKFHFAGQPTNVEPVSPLMTGDEKKAKAMEALAKVEKKP